jgi:hypothetical protein
MYERSEPILIKKSCITKINNSYYPNTDYSLKQNFFDPSKSSPPNNFMEKLQKRISIYNSKISFTASTTFTSSAPYSSCNNLDIE